MSADDTSKDQTVMEPMTLERPRLCRLCEQTVARENSALCTLCQDEIEWRDKYEFAVENRPTCPVDGAVLDDHNHCWECVERSRYGGHAEMRKVS